MGRKVYYAIAFVVLVFISVSCTNSCSTEKKAGSAEKETPKVVSEKTMRILKKLGTKRIIKTKLNKAIKLKKTKLDKALNGLDKKDEKKDSKKESGCKDSGAAICKAT